MTMNKRLFTPLFAIAIFLFMIYLGGCLSTASGRTPDWVTSVLSLPDYYVGIGSANSGNRAEDYQLALEKAKANLAADISVQIAVDRQTELFFTQEEQFDQKGIGRGRQQQQKTKESLAVKEKILQQVQSFLKEVEIAGNWYHPKEGVWIYVRLKKSLYEQNRQKEIARIRNRVDRLLKSASDEKGGSLYSQMAIVLKCYQLLSSSPFGDEVVGIWQGETALLMDLLEVQARNILQSLQFKMEAPSSLILGTPFWVRCQLVSPTFPGAWKVKLMKREGNQLLPITVLQLSPEGAVYEKVEGDFLKEAGGHRLLFQIDLSEWETLLPLFSPELVSPSAELAFSIETPRVGLKVIHSEMALKKHIDSTAVALLVEKGLPFSFDLQKEQSNQLFFELDFFEIPQYMEGQPLMVRGHLVVRLQKDGVEIFSYELASAKGAGLTKEQAKQNCWRQLQKHFKNDEQLAQKLLLAF